MAPPDTSLAPVPRDLTGYNITTPKSPNCASCFTSGDRIAAREEARARKSAKRARVMHLRCSVLTAEELAEVSGWQDVPALQKYYLMRDMYDEKERKEQYPLPPIDQDATLESEIWTLDEVNWRETTQDTTTTKYVPVLVRPMVARLRERVAKVATEETGPQQVRAWKLFLSLDKMLFHTSLSDSKRTNNTSLADRGRNMLEIFRQSQQTSAPYKTTKPSTDPSDPKATEKHHQRTIQLVGAAVEDGDGRRAGKLVRGISGMAPAVDVRNSWTKLYPEPKTQTVDSETLPFTNEDRQDFFFQLLLAIKISPRTAPRDQVRTLEK